MQFHLAERRTFYEAPRESFGYERGFERRARKGDKAMFVILSSVQVETNNPRPSRKAA